MLIKQKVILIFSLITFISASTNASLIDRGTVYFQSIDSSDYEFEAYVLNKNNAQTYSDYIIENSVSIAEKNNLFNLFKKAKFQFLQGNSAAAEGTYVQITEQALKNDWGLNERKIIHQSYLRLGQLSKTESERTLWMKEAIYFDDELQIDSTAFTPLFVSEYKKLLDQESRDSFLFDITELRDKNVAIRINGRLYKTRNGSQIKVISKRNVRITLISNKYSAETYIGDTKKISTMSIDQKVLVAGSCQNPSFFNSFNPEKISLNKEIEIFYSKNCISPLEMRKDKNLVLVNQISPIFGNNLLTNSNQIPNETNSNTKSWIIGGAILVTILGVIAYSSSRKSNNVEKRPTHE